MNFFDLTFRSIRFCGFARKFQLDTNRTEEVSPVGTAALRVRAKIKKINRSIDDEEKSCLCSFKILFVKSSSQMLVYIFYVFLPNASHHNFGDG
jgi:hypothetical protein